MPRLFPEIPADWMYLLDSVIPGRTSARKTALQLAAACIALLEVERSSVEGFARDYCKGLKLPVQDVDLYKSDILKLQYQGLRPSHWRWDYRVMMAVDVFNVQHSKGTALRVRLDQMVAKLIGIAKAADKAQGHEAEKLRFGMGLDIGGG
ncbi:hypothetical protein LTR78_006009 [Recurvomyces mirabilis]|uniref:Uncharacterized protein n=1 Tax=Recurvomyces mirabilis TaxID=574656 RepID=A0AAE0WM12_9PEZI|nr:hypothetical protein LTR78_006009 [Recurvomyces mirabilis]KAK5155181.1 hypothetical protein LTS14_006136 [Recurvomyces mirabilis]